MYLQFESQTIEAKRRYRRSRRRVGILTCRRGLPAYVSVRSTVRSSFSSSGIVSVTRSRITRRFRSGSSETPEGLSRDVHEYSTLPSTRTIQVLHALALMQL